MERKKNWKDFHTFVNRPPNYRAWMYCKDPEAKAMHEELARLIRRMTSYDVQARRTPMPEQLDDMYLYRMSAHISQRLSFSIFLEILFENSLLQGSDENLNLIFSFLDAYITLLKNECILCKQQNPPGK